MAHQFLEDPSTDLDKSILPAFCEHDHQYFHHSRLPLERSDQDQLKHQGKARRSRGGYYFANFSRFLQLDNGCVH